MPSWHNCSRVEVGSFWKKIEQILLNGEYAVIKKLNLSMRNSFYHLLTFVSKMLADGEISEEQLYYWNQEEAYAFFVQDKWSGWEKKYNWRRPKAKDPTSAIYRENLIDLTTDSYSLKSDLNRFQGFIFIEKSGFMDDLKIISSYGWCVLSGQGFSSRELRETIQRDFPKKPIVVLHDFDRAGEMIFDVFEKGSVRTKHLDLKFENLVDLGLREVDVEELNLPKAPEAERIRKKDKSAWRVELNALTILYQTHGIKNPLLWYLAKRMFEEGLNLYEEATTLHKELESYLRNCVWYALIPRITRNVEEALKKFNVENIDVIELKDEQSTEYWDSFKSKEFDYLDQCIREIIWQEIHCEAHKAEDVAKECLKIAGVDSNE